jgi:hypothetical protein
MHACYMLSCTCMHAYAGMCLHACMHVLACMCLHAYACIHVLEYSPEQARGPSPAYPYSSAIALSTIYYLLLTICYLTSDIDYLLLCRCVHTPSPWHYPLSNIYYLQSTTYYFNVYCSRSTTYLQSPTMSLLHTHPPSHRTITS